MALGEFELIYRYFSSLGRGDAVALGVGDQVADDLSHPLRIRQDEG